MLTQHDIDMMAMDVREIIGMWNTKLTIYKPLPIEQQTHWNNLLNEYSGSVAYNKYVNVVAERKDQQNMTTYDLDISNQAGDKAKSRLIFTFPDTYLFIDETCRIIYEGNMYYIVLMKHRIGEILAVIDKCCGATETWDIANSTIDVGDSYR